MRILCVSLLRLGDLLIQAPALRGLRRDFPDAELHLLTNRSNQSMAEQLRDIDKIHYFERDRIQESLGQKDRSVFEAEDRIVDLMKRLQRQSFDKVINFSHTKLSGYIVGLCQAQTKIGLQVDSHGRFIVESGWYRFLNGFRGDETKHHYHYGDFFCLANGKTPIGIAENLDILKRTESGSDHDALDSRIVINPWSSDKKKDWSDQAWVQLMSELKTSDSEAKFYIVAGPDKVSQMNALVKSAATVGVDVVGVQKNFSDLTEFLQRQRLLITIDSVVKHLAPYAQIKVIEIALGGSSPWKTGVHMAGALIIHGAAECAPCDNHKPCFRNSHKCGEGVDAKDVAAIAAQYIAGQWLNLRVLAEETQSQMKVYRTAFTRGGYWHLVPMWAQAELQIVEHLVNLAAWKVVLEKGHLDPMFNFGQELKNFESEDHAFNRRQLQLLEAPYHNCEMALDSAINSFIKKMKSGVLSGYRETLEHIEKSMGLRHFLTQYLDRMDTEGFGALRRVQDGLNQLRQFQITKMNLQRSAITKEL